ncbi:MAG: hypothetical protein ABI237_08330 [Ginsengibacter sp.]
MNRKIIILFLLFSSCLSLFAQDYPQWPADKPETGFIEESQSREIRIHNLVLPQEIDMQDKMRVLITDMMQDASKRLGWDMVELSEYTNDNAFQNGGTPYNLRSPRGIEITFQFVVNNDSLLAWKKYESDYEKRSTNSLEDNSTNMQSIMESAKYKQYRDSADYYLKLYLTYCEAHKNEGTNLYTKDKHPKYYQQKETEFIDKANAMVQQTNDNSGIKESEDENKVETRRFRNHTVVQVKFHVNAYSGLAIDRSGSSIQFTSTPYPIPGAILSKLYTVQKDQEHFDFDKWDNVILTLVGKFQTKLDKLDNYNATYTLNGQGDEHTPKKIKSEVVQDISINIYGDKTNVEKMAGLIDVEKLNNEIIKK